MACFIVLLLIQVSLFPYIEKKAIKGSIAQTSLDAEEPTSLVTAESHFGVHLGSFNYNESADYIRELGDQIYVRNEFHDTLGWRQVKDNNNSILLCEGCCDPSISPSCECQIDDFYYCNRSREGLLSTPILIDFYNNSFNQFVNFYTSRYDDTPPTTLVAAYPYGHEDIYQEYVSFIVQNFGDQVKYWEVGNENDISSFWNGTPEEYANMTTIASAEIRENCADCNVGISFSIPNITGKYPEQSEQWFNAIGNICNSFDFIDAHWITAVFIEQGVLDEWKQTCPGKEFFSTETGIPDNEGYPLQTAGGSMERQAQDLIKLNTLMFAEGYDKIFWYLVDTDYGGGGIFLYNALIEENNTVKPAFYAYKTMISKVDYFINVSKLADGQYKYNFTDRDPVYILWCGSGNCSLPLEISGQVNVTDYIGNETTTDASQINLTESPIFVQPILAPCIENWNCTSWSSGSCGTRQCIDLNDCGTEADKPAEELGCESGGSGDGGGSGSSRRISSTETQTSEQEIYTYAVEFEQPIRKVTLRYYSFEEIQPQVFLEEINTASLQVPEVSYFAFNLSIDNPDSFTANLDFIVPRSWMQEHNIPEENIFLYSYENNEWKILYPERQENQPLTGAVVSIRECRFLDWKCIYKSIIPQESIIGIFLGNREDWVYYSITLDKSGLFVIAGTSEPEPIIQNPQPIPAQSFNFLNYILGFLLLLSIIGLIWLWHRKSGNNF